MPSTSVNGLLANFPMLRINHPLRCCPILSLPYDIFLDHVFLYLYVEDIICLRRVNKLFYLLTCEPIIWKRFLQTMKLPLPPLRPTYRFSLQKFDFEAEQLVTRAISLDDNWRNHNTAVRKHKTYTSDRLILEMKLLPGGKHLVTSDTDEKRFRYSLTIYSLENTSGLRPVARMDTGTRVFHMQARYMKYKGQHGIVIACVRRHPKDKADPLLESCLFSVDTEIDTPVPFEYELLCSHTPLESLEMASDPDIRRGTQEHYDRLIKMSPPFHSIAYMGSRSRIEFPTLFEYNQEPFIAFAQQPGKIHFKNLNSGIRSLLQFQPVDGYSDKVHRIRCIRALPGQRDIFVIRSVDAGQESDAPLCVVELFDMPLNGEKLNIPPREQQFLDDKHMTHFFISDLVAPPSSHDQPKLRQLDAPPPPISIYIRTKNPNSLVHYKLWPEHVPHLDSSRVTYYYTTRYITDQSIRMTDSEAAFVLPGMNRSIVYNVPEDDRTDNPSVLNLRKYIDPGYRPIDLPDEPDDDIGDILRNPRFKIPHKVFSTVKLPSIWSKKMGEAGLSAITWDEGIGRVCLSVKDDQTIRVLDFAASPTLDTRFACWRKQQYSLA